MAVAVPVEGPYETHTFTVADGQAIPQYTLCFLSGATTVAPNTGAGQVFAGVAAMEKVAADGSTEVSGYTKGWFDLTNNSADGGPTIIVGSIVSLSGANGVKLCTEAELVTGDVVGKCYEAITNGGAGVVAVGAI